MTRPDNITRDHIPPTGLLARLARVNVTSVFLATIVFILVALFAPGIIGGSLILVLAAGLAALMAKTWPVQAPQTRVLRLTMLTMLLALAFLKIF